VVDRRKQIAPRKFRVERSLDIAVDALRQLPDDVVPSVLTIGALKPPGEATPEVAIRRTYAPADAVDNPRLEAWVRDDADSLRPIFQWLGVVPTG
jgi:hypothetical protein